MFSGSPMVDGEPPIDLEPGRCCGAHSLPRQRAARHLSHRAAPRRHEQAVAADRDLGTGVVRRPRNDARRRLRRAAIRPTSFRSARPARAPSWLPPAPSEPAAAWRRLRPRPAPPPAAWPGWALERRERLTDSAPALQVAVAARVRDHLQQHSRIILRDGDAAADLLDDAAGVAVRDGSGRAPAGRSRGTRTSCRAGPVAGGRRRRWSGTGCRPSASATTASSCDSTPISLMCAPSPRRPPHPAQSPRRSLRHSASSCRLDCAAASRSTS